MAVAVAIREPSSIWARLNVFDISKIKQLHESGNKNAGSPLIQLLGTALGHYGGHILRMLADGVPTTDEGLTHICASGLTARELMVRIAMIPQKDIRDKLAETLLPYILSPAKDDKSDITVEDHASAKASSSRKIEVYYAKCVLHRENKKYYINVAYYHFDSVFSHYSLTALLGGKKQVKRDLAVASAVAFNRLHLQLKLSWPNQIELVQVTDPSAIEQA